VSLHLAFARGIGPGRPFALRGGYLIDEGHGIFDAWGRRYRSDIFPPDRGTYLNDWEWSGNCPPAVVKACPSPRPTPAPTPTPSVSPSPVVPADGGVVAVKLHECPAAYPRRPDHVKVGGNARRAPANPFSWLFNLTPQMTDARYCANENGGSRGVPCEQWIPCAIQGLHDPADPLSSWEPAVMAWGPGEFAAGDKVESRSREAEPWEKPCPPEDRRCYINYYLRNLVIGPEGSPPGIYHVCAAPTQDELDRARNTECVDFKLTLP
jgi:hypothetical protein